MTNSVFVTSNSDLEKCSTDLQSEKPRLFSLNLRAGESGFIFQFFQKNREFMDLIPQNHDFFRNLAEERDEIRCFTGRGRGLMSDRILS